MPESKQGFAHLFIWYLAPEHLEADFRDWLLDVEESLGVKGELFLRKDKDSENRVRMTFMETYRNVDEGFITRLEALASHQSWHSKLLSPRRCEAFNRIE
ncbi:MAG: DUF4936 family protein [Mariprofundaceae bacterium]